MTVHDERLSALLTEFAQTLPTDFPVPAILDRLVERVADLLPVSGAGVTLIVPGLAPHYIAASNDSALRYERLQSDLGEGPCREAYELGEVVSCPDLREETRFASFTEAALGAGLAAAFAFPLRHSDGRLGALDLYRETRGLLAERDMVSAQTVADVTADYVLKAKARYAAGEASDRFLRNEHRDRVTGLGNRLLVYERLGHAARRASRSGGSTAVLVVDLDRFTQVNDAYGHRTGDELLVAVGRRLAQHVHPGDTLARVSGDEFVVVCEDLSAAADVEALGTRIRDALRVPFQLSRQQVVVSASVGTAYAGPGEAVSSTLLEDVDMAMYQAKRERTAGQRTLDLREARRGARLDLGQELDDALAQGQLDLAYQPIVSSTDGTIVGMEALLRWTHPQRGPIPAEDVVGIAEDHGLIARLGAWVLDRACSDHVRWRAGRPRQGLFVSVNVSPRQLLVPGFVQSVSDSLRRSGTAPGNLVLEVPGGIFVGDPDRALTVLADLKGLGVRIALDDFGSGLFSLSYLRAFDVDLVKIDRPLVAGIEEDRAAAGIIAALVRLAHRLTMLVVAEGVETTEQSNVIAAMGCDFGEGFRYARPMRAGAVAAILDAPSLLRPPSGRVDAENRRLRMV